ncbi:hypothetical protein PHMEG_0002639 [Phytophthora megakarya]|uniref:Uncharacterized protein n=1 Tax=Phytophthora megakarya TaxID=4795 RepID=A0A225X013_9STRA|nr:hypothetical protein PHMEG_0002639 [Phytophthora megakarya]
MRLMMADMDAIKTRLQQRFAAERQARTERLEREDRERKVQEAAHRKAQKEACSRQVEASVQTEGDIAQQQMQVSQRNECPSKIGNDVGTAVAAPLPAGGGGTGFADMVPNKAKPAGLSLYDLVKTTEFDLSRKIPSPVHRTDPPEVLPMRSSNKRERLSPQRQQFHDEPGLVHDWNGGVSQLSVLQDSIVGDSDCDDDDGYSTQRQDASINAAHSYLQPSEGEQSLPPSPQYDNENLSSVSNSLVSCDAGKRSAVSPDLIQRRDHKFNAAALLSTGKRPPASITNDDDGKTDEQREMEAIQCLLFGR